MAFVNFPSPTPLFPSLPSQSWSVLKTPSFSEDVSVAISGRETQLSRTAIPRWTFTLKFGGDSAWLREQTQNRTPYGPQAGFTELEQISGLFLACLGSYGEFYFDDPQDHSRFGALIGYGDGATTVFPILVPWGAAPQLPAGLPIFSTPIGGINSIQAVYINGILQPTSNYGPDSSNSMLQFGTPPLVGLPITMDLFFYFRCRFLDDKQEYDQWAYNLWEYKTCRFESVKA